MKKISSGSKRLTRTHNNTRNRRHGYNHSRPTQERERTKKVARTLFDDGQSSVRSPSTRKAAEIAREKINDISMQH